MRLIKKTGCSTPLLFHGTSAKVAVISESGLYKITMGSDKPQAKAFQDWVTKEVLPSIRKTGYSPACLAFLIRISPDTLVMRKANATASTKGPRNFRSPMTSDARLSV